MPNPLKLMMGAAGVSTGYAGTLWVAGYNASGLQGSGDAASNSTSSPIQIGASTNWTDVNAGTNTHCVFALRDNNTLWSWGAGVNGVLGLGDQNNRSSPTQVGSLTTWESANSGAGSAHAIKTDGTLWGWGDSPWGAMGDGTVIDKSSPIQIGSLTTWDKVANNRHCLAIKDDDTLWSWGLNNKGEVGDGTVIYRSSPVQVGSLTLWADCAVSLAASFGILTNGKLYQWGAGVGGEPSATGNVLASSSPIQVGALTTWSKLVVGQYHAMAIKTDGTLWAWGRASHGQLGDNAIVSRSSPVQVGAETDWATLTTTLGNDSSAAIKTDGTLWAWGRNHNGQLAVGDVINRSSPTQVVGAGSEKWTTVSMPVRGVMFMIGAEE